MAYQLSEQYLQRYADLLVNFALGGGQGIARGDVVHVIGNESSKPLYAEVSRAVWRAGGTTLSGYEPDADATTNLRRDFFQIASDEQISAFHGDYYKGLIDEADHLVYIEAQADPHALGDVAPAKLMTRQAAMLPLVQWQDAKENAGDFTWTIALYGTEGMAAEARLSIDEYWEQIIAACFLDKDDPIGEWRRTVAQIQSHVAALDALDIDRVHMRGADVDLKIKIGESRRWVGGGGRNIPSFEVFTSPDWRGTEGWIRFSEPLYIHGNLITGIELEFAGGLVTRASAKENEPLLTEMLAADNANKVGEFSLTDARLSRITKFMATTLFDENVGGPYGNSHIAVGKAIPQGFAGDPSSLATEDWERLGFNDSVVHTDIVTTTDREVTATLRDGSEKLIYAGGQFQLDE